MNIIFFGSSQFAVPPLKALLDTKHKVSCVVTQPDRQRDRGFHLGTTAVKVTAKKYGLKIYQPEQINTAEAVKFLKNLRPDLFIVVAYGQILSEEILNIPKVFSINLHASLLPRYRGAAPINWAVINGENSTGVTIIKMVKKMDAGPIIAQEAIDIDRDDTSIILEDKLSALGAKLLINSLKYIEDNNYKLKLQDENKVTFSPKLKKEDGLINWKDSAEDIYNLIRGCLSWPGAFTYYKGKLVKIYKAGISPLADRQLNRPAGEIIDISKTGIVVATGKDNLIIEELQLEGKRKMRVDEFIAGHKINIGDIFKN